MVFGRSGRTGSALCSIRHCQEDGNLPDFFLGYVRHWNNKCLALILNVACKSILFQLRLHFDLFCYCCIISHLLFLQELEIMKQTYIPSSFLPSYWLSPNVAV